MKELSDIPLINSLTVLISVFFGFWLKGLAQNKKDKKEAEQIINLLHDEIKSNFYNNLNKDFSSDYLSVLVEEVLKAKMGILAKYHKGPLDYFIKIYRQFINLNKALSDYNNLSLAAPLSLSLTTTGINLPQIEKRKEIKQLRKLCKEDILIYLNKYPK